MGKIWAGYGNVMGRLWAPSPPTGDKDQLRDVLGVHGAKCTGGLVGRDVHLDLKLVKRAPRSVSARKESSNAHMSESTRINMRQRESVDESTSVREMRSSPGSAAHTHHQLVTLRVEA